MGQDTAQEAKALTICHLGSEQHVEPRPKPKRVVPMWWDTNWGSWGGAGVGTGSRQEQCFSSMYSALCGSRGRKEIVWITQAGRTLGLRV